jgi:sugar lactone lactonase YvrE
VPSPSSEIPSPSAGPPVAELTTKLTAPDPAWKPLLLSMDPAGRIWASDAFNDRFSIFDASGAFIEFWGERGTGPGQFQMQRSNSDSYGNVAFASDGTMFALDIGNRRVQVFDSKRRFVKQWGTFGSKPGELAEPVNLAVGPNDTVYLLDDIRGVIIHYDRDGRLLDEFDAFPNARSGASLANSMAIDAAGNLYVSQLDPFQVTRFDGSGQVTGVFGSPGTGAGQFAEQPGTMAVDANGDVFINQGPDRQGQPAIDVFDADGTYRTGFGSAEAGDLHVAWPAGMLLVDGDLFVSDVGNPPGTDAAIRKFKLLPPLAP